MPIADGVNPALGLYVPLPETVAVPTVVPPLVQVLGAVVWGPKTVNVIVPVAPLAAPDRTEEIALVAIVVPAVPVVGPVAVVVVAVRTAVDAMPLPHVLAAALLLASPP